MGEKTGIQWVQDEQGNVGDTWNPLTGCTKVSPGCANCYAEAVAIRMKGNPVLNASPKGNKYRNGFELTLHPDTLDLPLRKKKPRAYFVNSMSDLFHAKVPVDYIKRVFETMNQAHWHRFMVLTKRADRVAHLAEQLNWTPNIWMGVSVESEEYLNRINFLLRVPAHVRWVSAEPLLGPLGPLHLHGIDWVVAGGESGPKARPFDLEWARELRDQCSAQGAAFFMKQMGENPVVNGVTARFKHKKGGDISEFPADLQIRQMPEPKQLIKAGQMALGLDM